MKKFIPGIQTAYCPKDEDFKDVYLVLSEVTTLGDNKIYGFEKNECPERHDCEHADYRGFCPFVKNVLDRFSR